MHSPAASAAHGGLAANLPGGVIGGVIFAVVSIGLIRWLARRRPAPAPVPSGPGGGVLASILAFAAIVGITAAAGNDHHTPAPAVPPVRAPVTPPKVVVVHPAAPAHFPLTGTEIVWIVVILTAAWVAVTLASIREA